MEQAAEISSAAAAPQKREQAPHRTARYGAYLAGIQREKRKIILCQIALIAGFLVLWQIAPKAGWVNPMLTSYPTAVIATLSTMAADGTLFTHTLATLKSTVIGFTGGMVLGILAAVALWWSPFIYRTLDPFVVVLNALPKIALVPIFYIWLGDKSSIYAMAIVISVFVTILMLYTGFCSIDPNKIKLVRIWGASRFQVLTKVILPGSVPTMISTLKVNIGLALVGVVVGEFQAANAGLGFLINYGSQIFQMNLVMASIVSLALLSTLLFIAVQLLEGFIMRRRSAGA
ncbi:ABC transporter permease [Acuticoccus sp. MNP-M23]|uniref:ABC transporter permease n=1 Tax=Acuticoccus sp. MNP-M23 TaxID=3072793 RepID=UPI0028156D2B|nr:ABC transporter permease [Acuticoccus sp. MNP-M23]WMS41585.1 ABC transporter permease [Acuticoccus sp. MNP-M23]